MYLRYVNYTEAIASKFASTHTCVDREELISEARFLLIKAWDSWDSELSSFRNWVWLTVWNGLKVSHRRVEEKTRVIEQYEARRRALLAHREDCINDLTERLSSEAKLVVMKVIHPKRLKKYLAISKHLKAQTVRGLIRKALRRKGWSDRKISRCFREVRRSLRGKI
jgi:hypothetical protein